MKVVVTGADGFLGWHTRCGLRARSADQVVTVGRSDWSQPDQLDAALTGSDAVLHLAGRNRGPDDAVAADNVALARALTAALDRTGARPRVVYANSTHAGEPTSFGQGKLAAGDHLLDWADRSNGVVVDARVPNLFGEHGRPHYNSFVATFCHELAHGRQPVIDEDRELTLMHVQDAVDHLLDLTGNDRSETAHMTGARTTVRAVRDLLTGFHATYAHGDIPDVADPMHRALFNTYRSFLYPQHFPIHPPLRSDDRGDLFEALRAHGNEAHVFCSTTRPGRTRGEHFHLRKIERFLVLSGTAEIAMRKLFDDDVIKFAVSGDKPAIVDMPTMWAHSITNTGATDLTTMFWTNEIFDPEAPDTYLESVHQVPVS